MDDNILKISKIKYKLKNSLKNFKKVQFLIVKKNPLNKDY